MAVFPAWPVLGLARPPKVWAAETWPVDCGQSWLSRLHLREGAPLLASFFSCETS